MNVISVAKETKKIIKEDKYVLNGTTIYLPALDYTDVQVYSPESGENLLKRNTQNNIKTADDISILAEDSF